MEKTPINRPVRPENLAAALKRNMARRKQKQPPPPHHDQALTSPPDTATRAKGSA